MPDEISFVREYPVNGQELKEGRDERADAGAHCLGAEGLVVGADHVTPETRHSINMVQCVTKVKGKGCVIEYLTWFRAICVSSIAVAFQASAAPRSFLESRVLRV